MIFDDAQDKRPWPASVKLWARSVYSSGGALSAQLQQLKKDVESALVAKRFSDAPDATTPSARKRTREEGGESAGANKSKRVLRSSGATA